MVADEWVIQAFFLTQGFRSLSCMRFVGSLEGDFIFVGVLLGFVSDFIFSECSLGISAQVMGIFTSLAAVIGVFKATWDLVMHP